MRSRVSRLDRLGGGRHGAQPRAADHIDGHRRLLDREAGLDRHLPRHVLAESGLENATEKNLVDIGGLHAAAGEESLGHDELAEIHGGHAREREPLKLPIALR